MKPLTSPVPILTISDINSSSGKPESGNQFHVTKISELVMGEKFRRPVRANSFAFFLGTEGATHIKYNLIDYTILPNSLFMITPGIIHQVHPNEDSQVITIGFSQDFLAKSLLHKKHLEILNFLSSQSNPHLHLNSEEADTLNKLMIILRKSYANKDHPFSEDIMFHGFNLFMLEAAAMFKKYMHIDSVRLTRKEDILMSFLKLLAIHFREERSVQFYASELFVTPKHLTKTVKEITGKTCGEFIDEMVIAEAKILLDNHEFSVGNVADQLHFSDQFFFSKFFKTHTGVSPSNYKATAC